MKNEGRILIAGCAIFGALLLVLRSIRDKQIREQAAAGK
jgi:hypothetical protein